MTAELVGIDYATKRLTFRKVGGVTYGYPLSKLDSGGKWRALLSPAVYMIVYGISLLLVGGVFFLLLSIEPIGDAVIVYGLLKPLGLVSGEVTAPPRHHRRGGASPLAPARTRDPA